MTPQNNPVIWFEIPVKDIARARRFYETVLGLNLEPPIQMGQATLSFFPMEMGVVGAGGALIQAEHVQPCEQGTTVYFSVEAIDPVLERINRAGGKTCLPRTSIGEYGFMAHFQDTEGNRVALHEAPRSQGGCQESVGAGASDEKTR